MNNLQLPYFQYKSFSWQSTITTYFRRKFFPPLRKILPHHYLLTQDIRKFLSFIKENSQKHPYFLRFDIKKYYPSIDHQILLKEIPNLYQTLSKKPLPRRMKSILKKELPAFLSLSPFKKIGLPLGNPLSHILSGLYLLKLDLSLNAPFLRFCDDYLIFGKKQTQLKEILSQKIIPVLSELSLSLNIEKFSSGKFHQDKLNFLGFQFYAGYIKIPEEKINEFKKKVIKITHLTKKKAIDATIKLLNNQILGFGHYSKFSSCHNVFKDLDAFCRSRLRRYILRNRDLLPKTANLYLTNEVLKELGLKSLLDIKLKFDKKIKKKIGKSEKFNLKTGRKLSSLNSAVLQEISDKYLLKQILLKLNELEKIVKKLEKKIRKMN